MGKAWGKLVRRTLIYGVLAAAVAIAVPFVVPVAPFIPDITRLASEKLGQPVTMEDLRLHLIPKPRIVGSRITVGKSDQVMIGELEIEPDLLSFVLGPRTIRLIRAERVAIDESVFQLLAPRGRAKASPGQPIVVRRLVLDQVRLEHRRVELPLFDVEVHFDESLRVQHARFEARDGSLRLDARPMGLEATELTFRAANWTLPLGAPLTFETLAAQGTLRREQLELSSIEGLLYGGKVIGSVRAEWGAQWQLVGKAQVADVDLAPVQKALGKPAKFSGRLKADAAFSTRAQVAAELREALALDGPFEVVGGTYRGVDLSKAGQMASNVASSDATAFEELKGKLEVRGALLRINELCMRSPNVVAGGNVEIAPDRKLSGKLDLSVAKTGGFVGIPVSLGGTTDDPSLSPSAGYLIGAAIGTVLLPVIGTSIGSSLASRIEGTSGCK